MLTLILSFILTLLACTCTVLRKVYGLVPLHELKRRAAHGNESARSLYQAASHGESLSVLLWIGVVISTAAAFALLVNTLPDVIAVVFIAFLVWLIFWWLPKTSVGNAAMQLTVAVTPTVAWLLHYLQRPLQCIAQLLQRYSRPRHSGLYELQDMLDLLDLQSQQPDSRITNEEIQLIRKVIHFGDTSVSSVMRPRLQVRSVSLGDAIGPVLLDELHASGQTVFPVKKTSRSGEIVGALHLGDIGIHSQGAVSDYATSEINQVRNTDSLATALHEFYATSQRLLLVFDAEDDYIGIVTLEAILESLVPQQTDA